MGWIQQSMLGCALLFFLVNSITHPQGLADNVLNFYLELQLALKDAEKVVSLRSSSVKSYILKANALVMVRI